MAVTLGAIQDYVRSYTDSQVATNLIVTWTRQAVRKIRDFETWPDQYATQSVSIDTTGKSDFSDMTPKLDRVVSVLSAKRSLTRLEYEGAKSVYGRSAGANPQAWSTIGSGDGGVLYVFPFPSTGTVAVEVYGVITQTAWPATLPFTGDMDSSDGELPLNDDLSDIAQEWVRSRALDYLGVPGADIAENEFIRRLSQYRNKVVPMTKAQMELGGGTPANTWDSRQNIPDPAAG